MVVRSGDGDHRPYRAEILDVGREGDAPCAVLETSLNLNPHPYYDPVGAGKTAYLALLINIFY